MLNIIIDTNVLLSYMLSSNSIPGKSVRRAFEIGNILYSSETIQEFSKKMFLKKFNKYLPFSERITFFQKFLITAEEKKIITNVEACRDPKDNIFLSLAVSCSADIIVTGDKDLLVLHPFQGIKILSPAHFLQMS